MKRDAKIDFLKAIGIFLVVLGHTASPLKEYIYTFHMPLFFFVTGFLRYGYKNISWKEFLKKKILKILVPYICFWFFSVVIYKGLYDYLIINKFEIIGFNEIKGLLLGRSVVS